MLINLPMNQKCLPLKSVHLLMIILNLVAFLNKNVVNILNKFRVNFKHRIAPNEAFDGKIGVQGVVDKGIKYENKLCKRIMKHGSGLINLPLLVKQITIKSRIQHL